MFFNRKNKGGKKKCESCGSNIEKKYSFCPHCGISFLDSKEEDYGLLGKNDIDAFDNDLPDNIGIADKIVGSIMSSMMRNLNKQFKNFERDFESAEVKSFPNGIRIKIGPHYANQQMPGRVKPQIREIGEEQMKKFSSLPRIKAKTNVKRIGDKVIYELSTLGVTSPEDVFISKLESGYEIKAIGTKKVFVNSIPINLPIKRYSILNNKLLLEFVANDNY